MTNYYDCIVIGAGIIGSSTAYQLKKKHGKNVLLLEQFPLLHSRGSSHGGTRLSRVAHVDDVYARMASAALHEYADLERASGRQLLNKCGNLWMAPRSNDEIQACSEVLTRCGLEHELVSGEQVSAMYPGLRYGKEHYGILDKAGGVLYADRCLRTIQEQFVSLGGVVHDNEQLLEVHPGEPLAITTTKQRYTTSSVILCLGSWAGPALKNLSLDLPLEPQLISVCFWETNQPEHYQISGFPAIRTSVDSAHTRLYGMPIEEYPNLFKLCFHGGAPVDPNHREQTNNGEITIRVPSDYLQDHFRGFNTKPSIVEKCIYTVTPDRKFIIDRHPVHHNIVIGAGFSGSGFKHAPIVGSMLAALALDQPTGFDITQFKISRFNKKHKL